MKQINPERFRGMRKIDVLAVFALALLWVLAVYIDYLFVSEDIKINYFLFILLTAFLVSSVALFVRRTGAVTMFCLIGSVMIFRLNLLNDVMSSNWIYRVLAFVLMGVIFEVYLLFFSFSFKNAQNIPFGVFLGTGIFAAMIPFAAAVLVSLSMMAPIIVSVWAAFALESFFIGMIGSVLSFLIGYALRRNRLIIKFEYAV